jgi:hypothetical protein
MDEHELIRLHFSVGQWIRNRFVHRPTPFAADLRALRRLVEPDDVSALITEAVWLDLRGVRVDLSELIEKYLGTTTAKDMDSVIKRLS